MEKQCPCGSGLSYAACCGVYINGQPAPTAQALMRSRYTAYVTRNEPYLLQSWHPNTRPEDAGFEGGHQPQWQALEVARCELGEAGDDTGTVEFFASFTLQGKPGRIHEISTFRKEDGRWYYLDGDTPKVETIRREQDKVGRNDPCPCGSGKKYKKCCGA